MSRSRSAAEPICTRLATVARVELELDAELRSAHHGYFELGEAARQLLRGRADVWATDRARPPRTALAWARNNVDCTAILRAAGAGQEEGLLHAARSGDQCALGALLASGVPAHAGGNHALSAACRGAHGAVSVRGPEADCGRAHAKVRAAAVPAVAAARAAARPP